jgi:hypothetical protein
MTREKMTIRELGEKDFLPLYDEEGELVLASPEVLRSPQLREKALWLHKMEKRLGETPEPSCVVFESTTPAK